MMAIARIRTGIRSHFQARMTEWLMLFPSVTHGIVFLSQPNLFDVSPSFDGLERYATQEMWGVVVLMCAIVRLAALMVNGTFETFRYSPHMRLAASIVGCLFWMTYDLGFLTAALFSGGSWTAIAAITSFVLFECVNVYRTSSDVEINKRAV